MTRSTAAFSASDNRRRCAARSIKGMDSFVVTVRLRSCQSTCKHPAQSGLGNLVAHDAESTTDITGVNDQLRMIDQSLVIDAIVVGCYERRVKPRYGFRSEGDSALLRKFRVLAGLGNFRNEWVVVVNSGATSRQ